MKRSMLENKRVLKSWSERKRYIRDDDLGDLGDAKDLFIGIGWCLVYLAGALAAIWLISQVSQ